MEKPICMDVASLIKYLRESNTINGNTVLEKRDENDNRRHKFRRKESYIHENETNVKNLLRNACCLKKIDRADLHFENNFSFLNDLFFCDNHILRFVFDLLRRVH